MAEELNQNMEAQAVSEAGAPAEGAAEVQVKQRGKTGRQIPSGIHEGNVHRLARQCVVLVNWWEEWFQGFAQEHGVCGSGDCR